MFANQKQQFSVLNSTNSKFVDVEHFNISFTKAEFSRLQQNQWLNDEIVNLYMELLNQAPPISGSSYCFSSHFISSMKTREKNLMLEKVLQKPKYNHLLQASKWIFPCNIKNLHWFLGVVDLVKKEIFLLDSTASTTVPKEWENHLEVFFPFLLPFLI